MKQWIEGWKKRLNQDNLRQLLSEMRWVLGYSAQYKRQVVWYICLGILQTGMGLGIGVLSKYIIDAVTGYDSGAILPAAIGYLAAQLVQIGVNAWTGQISAEIRLTVNQEIRADVFGRVLQADWESLSQFHSGDLLNRLNGDVNSVAVSVLGWIPDFITNLVRFGGTLLLILYYDPTMALLALASAPAMLVMSRSLMGKMRRHNVKMLEANSRMMAFNEEAFQNLQYIKSFDLAGYYQDQFQNQQENYREVQLDYNRFTVLTSALLSVMGVAVTSACFGWGVYRLWTGAITYGTMTLFLQQAGNLNAAFSSLVGIVPGAIGAATAAGRLMKVTRLPMEEQADTHRTEEFRRHAEKAGGVTLWMEKLRFAYQDGEEVLKNASFLVRPREVIALVGPSGEGKTTLLKLLLGLVNAREGGIWARAGELKMPVTASTRKLFAYVPQGNTMMSGTVRENLRLLNREADDEKLWKVLEEVCAADFVRKLPKGLDTYLKERGGGLSEGQLQRLSIARALLCDAPILLLDEATSALDVATERNLLRNVMNSERSRTCIVTTHRPSVLAACNRVYQVREGKVTQLDEEGIQQMVMEF